MIRRVVLVCAVMLLAYTATQAGTLCVPPTVEKNSPYRYLVSVAHALLHASEGLARVDDLGTDAFSLIVALRLQQSDYKCAVSQVAPYEASSDTIISESSQATAGIFRRLSQFDDEFVSQAKTLLEPDGSVSVGDMAERLAQAHADIEETWKLLVDAVILTTYSVVRLDPTTGRMSRLALTAAQRDEILGILRSGFGPSVAEGLKAGQHALVASAAVLYQVVGDPKRQVQKR